MWDQLNTFIIHLNDVEEIPQEFLHQFPQFNSGEVLLSLREVNMVMVLDPDTGEIKWHHIAPWLQQHGADWQADGAITVFDNRFDLSGDGGVLGGSNVISIDPENSAAQVLYGGKKGQDFYTTTQGDHQILGNGNILITESNAGRVIEVTSAGELVWEHVNRYSAGWRLRVEIFSYPWRIWRVGSMEIKSQRSGLITQFLLRRFLALARLSR